jgi:replicative DNA helicase Mcm
MLELQTEKFVEFYETYCEDDLFELGFNYPNQKRLTIDYDELWAFDTGLAEDYLSNPHLIGEYAAEAVDHFDLPNGQQMDDVTVSAVNLPDEHTHAPGELRSDHGGHYIGVEGTLERVTTTSHFPETLVYRCQRPGCGQTHYVDQDPTSEGRDEPAGCSDSGCGRQGPYNIIESESTWTDYVKIRIAARPDSDAAQDGKVTGFVTGDLIDEGGETGLIGRAGEPVTVYGINHRKQKSGKGDNKLLFDDFIELRGIEFDRDDDVVDVEAHREEFTELAQQPDAVDQFARSIGPQIHMTDAWDAAFEFAVAYLFGAPRVDIHDGPTYRGDLHFLMITDYAMGKSTLRGEIAAFSPKCIAKSTTALASGVGLTAAATKDDFGEGQWTLKPGLLVRANGGHLILDEIDKGPDELTEMNDALEGEQTVDVEKAGLSATYESRTGLMALGNPDDGRFVEGIAKAEQMGIDETLLSRFDGIVTMADEVDEETDRKIAETWGHAYTESQQLQYGEREELDSLKRPVPVPVGRAWIKHARENVNPVLEYEQFEELTEWYATEIREMNESISNDSEAGDMPVPATVRDLAAATKMAIAFARCHLREQVAPEDIERAKKLGKRLVGQRWDGDKFSTPGSARQVQLSDQQAAEKLVEWCNDNGGERVPANQIAQEVKIKQSRVNRLMKNRLVNENYVTSDGIDADDNRVWRIL